MREYEFTIIVQPQLEEGERDKLVENIGELLVPGADEESKPTANIWGMRRLAYPINKHTEGYYVLYEAEIDPSRIGEIERSVQYMEDVLRYLTVRKEN
ncbi:MAG: 30S ribosomal protein S6 [Candidatus Promineifilaceae bacterium]|nr:30S ribosomal protein S6 [Candidatus Promineifilaceae bacterium]